MEGETDKDLDSATSAVDKASPLHGMSGTPAMIKRDKLSLLPYITVAKSDPRLQLYIFYNQLLILKSTKFIIKKQIKYLKYNNTLKHYLFEFNGSRPILTNNKFEYQTSIITALVISSLSLKILFGCFS